MRRLTAVVLIVLCARTSRALAQEPTTAPTSPPASTSTEPKGFLAEPGAIERAVVFGDRNLGGTGTSAGWYFDFGKMVPGSGWIAAGPGYRRWYSKERLFTDASAGMSWHGYKTAQARIELQRLAHSRVMVGSAMQLQDLPQMDFFVEPSTGSPPDPTEYRLTSADVVGYATLRPRQWIAITADTGLLHTSVGEPRGWFKRDLLSTRAVFPNDPAFAGDGQGFVHSGVSILADTRDFSDHPTHGGVYRATASNYQDRGATPFSFRRYEAEAAQFVPVAGSRVVFALRGWIIASDTSEGQVVPFHLQPNLGGASSLRGYRDYRFTGPNMLLVNAEARVAMMTHVDAAVFVDAGSVAARAGDLDLERRSYGFGLRLHSRRETFARLDVARGSEGWRLLFRLNEPFTLKRLLSRTAPVPLIP